MSHLPVSLMNRLNQTVSAVFKLWMLYFQRIPFSDYFEKTKMYYCSCFMAKVFHVRYFMPSASSISRKFKFNSSFYCRSKNINLISTFISYLYAVEIICFLHIPKLSRLFLASLAKQGRLSLTWSQISEDNVSHKVAHLLFYYFIVALPDEFFITFSD